MYTLRRVFPAMCIQCGKDSLGGITMKVKINGQELEAREGETILELCLRQDINIPHLCYHPAFGGQGACRMCLVELKEPGRTDSRLVASCTYPIHTYVEVITESERIQRLQRNIVMLLARRASQNPWMKALMEEYAAPPMTAVETVPANCILCGLCIHACEQMGKTAIWSMFRGIEKRIATPYDEAADDCMGCAACALICPTQAIKIEEGATDRTIWNRSFELVACRRCGKNFATREQIAYMQESSGYVFDELCANCRKTTLAQNMSQYNQ